MSSNQQIPTSTPVKYAVESSSSYGSSSSNNLPLPSPLPTSKLSPGKVAMINRHKRKRKKSHQQQTCNRKQTILRWNCHLLLFIHFYVSLHSASPPFSNWTAEFCFHDHTILTSISNWIMLSVPLSGWRFHGRETYSCIESKSHFVYSVVRDLLYTLMKLLSINIFSLN